VIAVSDRISVFRDGRNAAIVEREGLTPDDLTELIVGSPIEAPPARPRAARAGEAAALEVRQLRKGPLAGVDLAVEVGELVGVAGINGSGRSTLLRTIFGVEDPDGGEIILGGEPIRFAGPKEAIAAGVAYVPEDRAENGLFPELSVIENLSAAAIRDYAPHRLLQHRRERRDAEAAISRFLIRTESPDAEVATLSGGNQQKIVLARWMRKSPRLLLLDEPTHGVDVGARAEISQLIRQAVGEGTAVIVVSSDFEELVELCDRVVALRGGVIDGELSGSDLSLDRLNQLMHTDRSRT
jgi:ribose transport system ATP-binding protein